MGKLLEQSCVAKPKKLDDSRIERLLTELDDWVLVEGPKITRTIRTNDFTSALGLVNRIGDLAEEEDHHPEITFTWGKVTVSLNTHSVGGLSENDFILAAKIDRLVRS